MADEANYLLLGLLGRVEEPSFRGITIRPAQSAPPVRIEPLHRGEEMQTFRLGRGDEPPRVLDKDGLTGAINGYLAAPDYEAVVCEMESETVTYTKTRRGISMQVEARGEAYSAPFRFDEEYVLGSGEARRVLAELGVLSATGVVRRKQRDKLIQIKNFTQVVAGALPPGKKELQIVDGASGKSYLSFLLYFYLNRELGYRAHFYGVDTNEELVNASRSVQEKLGYPHMKFFHSSLADFEPPGRGFDLLYSLHGCDTATDEAIAAGVRLGARAIIVAPCCHRELREQMRNHPLRGLTRYGLLEEQFAAMLTDALRGLALESLGYRVSMFRFVTPDVSAKNVMIQAVQTGTPPGEGQKEGQKEAKRQYQDLVKMFNVSPSIGRLLSF